MKSKISVFSGPGVGSGQTAENSSPENRKFIKGSPDIISI